MVLATRGLFDYCTPTMVELSLWDMEAFYAERFAQVGAQNALLEPQNVCTPRPKRAAAVAASGAWKTFSLRKRRRCDQAMSPAI
jgi:hypothetical protein